MKLEPTHCYAVPGENSIIDAVNPTTGLSWYNGETLEQVRLRYPLAELMLLDDYCTAKYERQNSAIVWNEISQEQYDEWFECLPPAAWGHRAFLVGEPSDHCAKTGRPRYHACRMVGDIAQAASRPMTRAEFTALNTI